MLQFIHHPLSDSVHARYSLNAHRCALPGINYSPDSLGTDAPLNPKQDCFDRDDALGYTNSLFQLDVNVGKNQVWKSPAFYCSSERDRTNAVSLVL